MSDNYRGGSWQGRGGRGNGGGGYSNNGGGRRFDNGGGGGGFNQYNNGGYYQSNKKRGREDDPMDAPAYRRRANERGDFNSPGRSRTTPLSLSGAQTQFKESIWKLGSSQDYEPSSDLPALAESIQDQYFRDKALVFFTFRAAITELPHKLAHYVALLAHLSRSAVKQKPTLASRIDVIAPARDDRRISGLPSRAANNSPSKEEGPEQAEADVEMPATTEESKVNVGLEIIRDLAKAVQSYLDERKWRNVRYCVQVFAHLSHTPESAPTVSPASFVTLLSSFVKVLNEPGFKAARGDECARIIVEALIHYGTEKSGIEDLKNSVQTYLSSRRIDRGLFGDAETAGQFEDPLDSLVSSLSNEPGYLLPDVYSMLPPQNRDTNEGAPDSEDPLALPYILVPPEAEHVDLLRAAPTSQSSSGLRGDEGVGYDGVRLHFRLFDDETVPTPHDPSGIILRSLIHDIVNVYEINRKEAAAILMQIPQWMAPGTFAPAAVPGEDADDSASKWILENIVVESILTSLFSLPKPRHALPYYHAVITELCTLSPTTVAPALGKCVRRLYAGLGTDGQAGQTLLDPEGIRRFAQWWSVHLSNFGFRWSWADWAPDMNVSTKHPKRVFVKRTVELEIRLSYYDRVKNMMPPVLLDTGVVAEDAPSASYAYESEAHPHSAAAASLLGLIRGKGTIGEVQDELAHFRDALLQDHSASEEDAESIKLDMAVQTILQVGSRSFSHFLNVLERYLALLRNLSASAPTRLQLLKTVASFWRQNPQFHLIVLDKLLQYRLVDSVDVISWVFASADEHSAARTWSDIDTWSALDITIKSVQIRIASAKARLETLTREQEVKAAEAEHEIDLDKAMAEVDNESIVTARTQLEAIEREFGAMVVEIVKQFGSLLPPDVNEDDWETWWIKGWFREFCRSLTEHQTLSQPAVVEGIAKLELPSSSAVVAILDSAKEWQAFVG